MMDYCDNCSSPEMSFIVFSFLYATLLIKRFRFNVWYLSDLPFINFVLQNLIDHWLFSLSFSRFLILADQIFDGTVLGVFIIYNRLLILVHHFCDCFSVLSF